MKDYGENLFLETWSHRLRINAIRHQGLIAILNVSVWRTGWLSVTAKGNLRADMVADVAEHLRELEEAVNFHTTRSTEEILQFPSDTVMVGNAKAQDVSFLVDPHPAPPSSIQSWLISNQMRRASTYGDLVAVFQVSIWGDDTIRAAFSGFPFKQDAEDVVAKIGQLAAMVEDNLSMYRRRQGIL
jgi:hypothetical protein